MSGRGAWPNSGRGGTLKRQSDLVTVPGRYYLLALGGPPLVGSAARDTMKAGHTPSLDDLAVNYGVKAIQQLLNYGHPTLVVDGVFGRATDGGVRAYQGKQSITVDGSVGPTTMGHLLLPHIKRIALTNWQTVSNSIKRMRNIEETLESAQSSGLKKKELLGLLRERDKLERSLGGIREMGGLPNMLFVIDTNKEAIAISEAKKLGIPVTAILDSNSDPDGIAYPIPGNDDAARALVLYCDLAARAIIDGLSQGQTDSGIDTGAAADLPDLTPAPEAAEGAQAKA